MGLGFVFFRTVSYRTVRVRLLNSGDQVPVSSCCLCCRKPAESIPRAQTEDKLPDTHQHPTKVTVSQKESKRERECRRHCGGSHTNGGGMMDRLFLLLLPSFLPLRSRLRFMIYVCCCRADVKFIAVTIHIQTV